jgi:hypothetical protein
MHSIRDEIVDSSTRILTLEYYTLILTVKHSNSSSRILAQSSHFETLLTKSISVFAPHTCRRRLDCDFIKLGYKYRANLGLLKGLASLSSNLRKIHFFAEYFLDYKYLKVCPSFVNFY